MRKKQEKFYYQKFVLSYRYNGSKVVAIAHTTHNTSHVINYPFSDIKQSQYVHLGVNFQILRSFQFGVKKKAMQIFERSDLVLFFL
jgi:hypothetical protein